MAWYDEAAFYHIYPLGLTGAPKENQYGAPEHRLNTLLPWIGHIRALGCNALYIGPLFQSGSHGYDTADYRALDSRLGTNEDLAAFVAECHRQGVRVILDAVLNHVGRDFFAFRDLKEHREGSQYRDWFCNVNFWGNNEYNDGFSYGNWGGFNLLVKLNQQNPEVKGYLLDTVRFWVETFDIDGLRLDAADVLDFGFMRELRQLANQVKPDFWLMGEVIHGDYTRWVNEGTLHAVTNYNLHKALWSGHNDHNYFEIAHTVKRLYDMGGSRPGGLKLYNFVDNHDVERIYTKLKNKAHFAPAHILLYTLPGVPSIYYGSEFAIEGRKEKWSDASLRPALSLEDYAGAMENDPRTRLIAALGRVRQCAKELSYGDYRELKLTTRQYAFSRSWNGRSVIVAVNNDDNDAEMTLPCSDAPEYIGALSGQRVPVSGGSIRVSVRANSGDIWLPVSPEAEAAAGEIAALGTVPDHAGGSGGPAGETPDRAERQTAQAPVQDHVRTEERSEPTKEELLNELTGAQAEPPKTPETPKAAEQSAVDEAFERGKIAGLQEAILALMEKRGPVTDQMRGYVVDNVYHDSLITWIKSF